MKNLAALAIALALILPLSVGATPGLRHERLPENGFEYKLTFPASDTDDSQALAVRGMCSVTWVRAGSDVVELYAVPTSSTAATSGTILGTFTTSTTAATTFQAGTMWVKAVATTAAAGGSIMRIHCSNSQVASTGEACTTAGLVPYVGDLGGYKCEGDLSYAEDDNELNVGAVLVDAVANKNVISMEANAEFTGPDPSATKVLMYPLTATVHHEFYIETLDSLNAPSRVVKDSPDYYDMVLSWGVEFLDIDTEYDDLGSIGTPSTQTFCMVRAAHSEQATTYTSADHQSLRSVTYEWIASGSGVDEYYVRLDATDGNASLPEPTAVFEAVDAAMVEDTLGSLAVGEYAYGDNDTLGFDTVYVRLQGATPDPDDTADGYVAAAFGTTLVTVPLTGIAGCGAGLGGTVAKRAFSLMGDPFIKDAWCTSAVNLAGGGTVFRTGDEIVVRFGVSNVQDVSGDQFSVSIHDMTYGYDEIDAYQTTLGGAIGKQSQLREAVNAYSSSAFTGSLDPGDINMVLVTATIDGMTRVAASTWNTMKLQCNMGILFKDTR